MSQDPRWRAESPEPDLPSSRTVPGRSGSSTNVGQSYRIADLSRTLAAHGAGSASAELAFDLVLHEILEETSAISQATGAAIGWKRDGKMVCRAATGEDAPDLGTQLDIHSRPPTSMHDEEIRNDRDANTDQPVNQELATRPSVRSMLTIPIDVDGEVCGILKLFSRQSNAFSDKEILNAQPMIVRILRARIEFEAASLDPRPEPLKSPIANGTPRFDSTNTSEFESRAVSLNAGEQPGRLAEYSNVVLLIAVLTVAIVLGLAIGWKRGKSAYRLLDSTTDASAAVARNSGVAAQQENSGNSNRGSDTGKVEDQRVQSEPPTQTGIAPGGLVISENGKLLYQSSSSQTVIGAPASEVPEKGSLLVKQVDPRYPPEAIARGVQGAVVLRVGVLSSGKVGAVVVESGDSVLTPAAVDAVKQWRFQPSPQKDQAIKRQTRVTIKFTLPTE